MALPTLCVVLLIAGAPALAEETRWSRIEASLPGLPDVMPEATGGTWTDEKAAEMDELARRHAAFEKLATELIPVAPRTAASDIRAGRSLYAVDLNAEVLPVVDFRKVRAMANRLAFLSWYRFRSGRPLEAYRLDVRIMRAGQDLVRSARSVIQGMIGLAMERLAYETMAQQLLEGEIPLADLKKLGPVVGYFARSAIGRRAMASVLEREQKEMERLLREQLGRNALTEVMLQRSIPLMRKYNLGAAKLLLSEPVLEIPARSREFFDRFMKEHAVGSDPILSISLANLGGLGWRTVDAEARSALMVAALKLAALRQSRRQVGSDSLPADPWTGDPLAHTVSGGFLLLASRGKDGELNDFDPDSDVVAAPRDLLERARGLRRYLRTTPLAKIGALKRPPFSTPPAWKDRDTPCEEGRSRVDRALDELRDRLGLEPKANAASAQMLLAANRFLDKVYRCPEGGRWRLSHGHVRCSKHGSSGPPEAPVELSYETGGTCPQHRKTLAGALEMYNLDNDTSGVDVSPQFQKELIEMGYLQNGLRCPDGGTYSPDEKWGVSCDLHPWEPPERAASESNGPAAPADCSSERKRLQGAVEMFGLDHNTTVEHLTAEQMAVFVEQGYATHEPRCPDGGTFSFEGTGRDKKIVCSVHGG